MANQIIPLDNTPDQRFEIALAVDGKTLRLRLRMVYNEMAGYWILSIADGAGKMLVDSIPAVTGDWPAANILGQYGYLAIGSAYILNASGIASLDYPNADALGKDFFLLWSDTAQ